MSLLTLQSQFKGLSFGPGTDIQLAGVTGLRSMPTRIADQPYPGRNGSLPGLHLLAERVIVYSLEIFAPKILSVEGNLAAAAAAFMFIEDPDGGLPLQFLLPEWSEPRQITARPTNNDVPIDQNYIFGKVPFNVQFTCADPLIYSTTQHSVTTGLPVPTAGAVPPFTFNLAFGASAGGSMQVTNAGNYPTGGLFTITGPCTNPYLTLGNYTFAMNITLAATDVLVIDMANLTVTLNGTASRFTDVVTGSTWFSQPVGISTVGFGSQDSAQVSATCTCQWYDAWGML